MKPTNALLGAMGTTIFTVMSALAADHQAINLGQGFPDTEGPEDIVRVAAEALQDQQNQYPPLAGVAALRAAVAAVNQRFYGLEIDAQTGVVVTSGATEAITACLAALLNPGDEVVLIEPLYDTYLPTVKLLGAVPKLVRLHPPHWDLPQAELAAAFGPRTKLILLNSPMNPTGKVFTQAELAFIAGLLQQHDAYAVCDEVYEHLVFSGAQHMPLAVLPGMAERCLRIGSAGKTFSFTGWKIGYVSGPAALVSQVAKAHQLLTFTTPPNLQRAVAYGLNKPDDYFISLAQALESQRDFLKHGLERLGFVTLPVAGSYFITADFSPLGFAGDDVAFCKEMTIQAGVTAIPVSAFYAGDAPPSHYVRFAFCKQKPVLQAALQRLEAWISAKPLTAQA